MRPWRNWLIFVVVCATGACQVYWMVKQWQMEEAWEAKHPCTQFTSGGWCKHYDQIQAK